jgi:hypothetical protein
VGDRRVVGEGVVIRCIVVMSGETVVVERETCLLSERSARQGRGQRKGEKGGGVYRG